MNDKDLMDKIINYWNTQPCNSKHSSAEVGTKEFFEQQSEKRYFVEPHLKDWAQFHLYQGKRVLEIGCGMGADAIEFVKHGAEYTATEISEESMNIAKKRFEVYGLEGTFLLRNGEDLSDIKPVDMVYSCGVLHHYPNPSKIIDSIYDVLVPGGEFKFLVYAANSWKYAMIRKGLDQYEAQAGCPYAKCYTKDEIYDLLGDKFTVQRIRQDHCFMYNVPKYKQGIYELEPWFAAMSDEMRQAVREYLGWHLLIKAVKN